MRILYIIAIAIYGFGIKVASLFNGKARLWVNGRKDIFEKIRNTGTGGKPAIWVHASSLGEFEQARPVIERIRQDYPKYRVVVTFFSPSGYEIRKNYGNADSVLYLPLDTPRNARRFLDMINPEMALFVKYDFWFNYLAELRKRRIPTFIFSTIFRPSQYFFKFYGYWFRKQLGVFTNFFVQNEASLQLLEKHGFRNAVIAGDTRFDQVIKIASTAKNFPEIEQFVDGKKVVIAGSSWQPDEKILHQFFNTTRHDVKLILAPHEIDDRHINQIKTLFGNTAVCYTELSGIQNPQSYRVLIINTMGMLSSIYRYSTVAYVGGGFGKGIHNILEAVVYGSPVCFGPNYRKFQEAKDIISLGGGKSINSAEDLCQILELWLSDENEYRKASSICNRYTAGNQGSAEKILSIVKNHLH